MTTLKKTETFFNTVNLTAADTLFVGIDVHKKSYHIALYLNDAPSIDFVMPAKKEQLSQKLRTMAPALRQIVYETGPTGYRLVAPLGLWCVNTSYRMLTHPANKLPSFRLKQNKT